MRHGHEIILAADATQNPPVIESIGSNGASKRSDKTSVNEPRRFALQPLQFLRAIQVVHVGNSGHADLFTFRGIHLAEGIVELSWSKEETGMRDVPVLQTSAKTMLSDFIFCIPVAKIR
jgi:hypothetical protein